MGWSGGVFSRIHNWVTDAGADIGIEADRHDEEDDNLSSGINACLNKNGENSPTDDIDFDGHKITALGDAEADTDALNRRSADARYQPGGAQCRITLSSGVPVMTADVSGATTVYVTPYGGGVVPIYNGTIFAPTAMGGQLSQATTDTTKSPAAATTNSNYDIFVWNDAGAIRATRGPPWSSATARGTGGGTTELEYLNGILVNKNAISNGPAARRGTYVGTIRTNGSSTVDWILGGAAAGGTAAVLGVWNMYNRRMASAQVMDTTNSWTTGTTAGAVAANGSNNNRVSYVSGIAEDVFDAIYQVPASLSTDAMTCGIGYDAVDAVSGSIGQADFQDTELVNLVARFATASLGFHYFQALDYQLTTTATTYSGDRGTAGRMMSLNVKGLF